MLRMLPISCFKDMYSASIEPPTKYSVDYYNKSGLKSIGGGGDISPFLLPCMKLCIAENIGAWKYTYAVSSIKCIIVVRS